MFRFPVPWIQLFPLGTSQSTDTCNIYIFSCIWDVQPAWSVGRPKMSLVACRLFITWKDLNKKRLDQYLLMRTILFKATEFIKVCRRKTQWLFKWFEVTEVMSSLLVFSLSLSLLSDLSCCFYQSEIYLPMLNQSAPVCQIFAVFLVQIRLFSAKSFDLP